MSRNASPVVGHGPSSPGIDRILLRESTPPATPSATACAAPPTAADDAYWRAHPEEFAQVLLAVTHDAFATK